MIIIRIILQFQWWRVELLGTTVGNTLLVMFVLIAKLMHVSLCLPQILSLFVKKVICKNFFLFSFKPKTVRGSPLNIFFGYSGQDRTVFGFLRGWCCPAHVSFVSDPTHLDPFHRKGHSAKCSRHTQRPRDFRDRSGTHKYTDCYTHTRNTLGASESQGRDIHIHTHKMLAWVLLSCSLSVEALTERHIY